MNVQLNLSSDPRNRKTYYFHATAARRLMVFIVYHLLKPFTRLEASGVENLPPSGPVVLAANHLTNFDVLFMQFALPRTIFFMGKEELFRNPLLDVVLRQLGGFPVSRGFRDDWAIDHAEQVLKKGQVLGIFPEGKRSKGLGLHRAKSGAARIALSLHCPIVPLAVEGTQRIGRRFPRRTQIQIQLGQPIHPQPGENVQALTDRMMFALAALLPSEQRGVYAELPPGSQEI